MISLASWPVPLLGKAGWTEGAGVSIPFLQPSQAPNPYQDRLWFSSFPGQRTECANIVQNSFFFCVGSYEVIFFPKLLWELDRAQGAFKKISQIYKGPQRGSLQCGPRSSTAVPATLFWLSLVGSVLWLNFKFNFLIHPLVSSLEVLYFAYWLHFCCGSKKPGCFFNLFSSLRGSFEVPCSKDQKI